VFRQTSGDTRLLDALDDSWRRHGSLDLVVWMDLALSTLNALTIENFLVGRVDRQFLRDEADARTRLPQLPDAIALDGRYPMNELHCQSGIWQEVVARLARESDVVLMDLRGFQQSNEGVIAELSLVVRHVRLSRIVLLTDARTDERLLADVVQNAWHALPPDSPNANASDLAQLQVVRSSASWSVTARAVARQVFTAGFGETPVQLARVS
jgi:hypothetical protein